VQVYDAIAVVFPPSFWCAFTFESGVASFLLEAQRLSNVDRFRFALLSFISCLKVDNVGVLIKRSMVTSKHVVLMPEGQEL
jgi:hypothetical protein